MKYNLKDKSFIGDYTLHINVTSKMWAIVIMPIQIRVDNTHGFVHIHFSHKGKHHKIGKSNFDEIYEIIVNHVENNEIISKKKIWGELS
ncbi:MAG: hypothetical protein LBR15_10285 [Methanobrevibacter sp.]|jgi:hypothetical protein|nr:hypothetical protein [Candidatus Methanovirga australis]